MCRARCSLTCNDVVASFVLTVSVGGARERSVNGSHHQETSHEEQQHRRTARSPRKPHPRPTAVGKVGLMALEPSGPVFVCKMRGSETSAAVRGSTHTERSCLLAAQAFSRHDTGLSPPSPGTESGGDTGVSYPANRGLILRLGARLQSQLFVGISGNF
jgi:hypothetical protein